MINIPISIALKLLWDEKTFTKNDWAAINLIVGPNGTGKSLFAEQLKAQLKANNFKVRLLNAERLTGFEKQQYSYFANSQVNEGLNISTFETYKSSGDAYALSTSAFVTMKERLDIRVRIEALLSDIFKKSIRLVEEGGYLKPKIQNLSGGQEYGMKEQECHGLKELLTLLTILYDDTNNCLILDEPELHLHPQFQSFFLSEIRRIAGDPRIDPSKKLFYIITHSPYFLELRELEDLKNVLVCHYESPPSFVDALDAQDQYVLKRFLPRFNTHHKQFFFSPNPVFVEGYTDQQIITILFDKLEQNISASGSSVVDVGGKDELAVFFRLCKKLNIKGRIIADLDAMFRGKLREVFQNETVCNQFIQENGHGTDLSVMIGDLERRLKEIADDLVTKLVTDREVLHLVTFLKTVITNPDKKSTVAVSLILALQRHLAKIQAVASSTQQANISFVLPRVSVILEALGKANIYIFPEGEIEHYYTQKGPSFDYLTFDGSKDTLFHSERDYLLGLTNKGDVQTQYAGLLSTLKKSIPLIQIDLGKHLKFLIVEWLQTVQIAISKGDVLDLSGLKTNAKVGYSVFSQIIQILDLKIDDKKRFTCKIQVNKVLSPTEKTIEFTEKTIAHEFEFTLD